MSGCTCGCGKTRRQVVREIMTTCTVNEEQADAMFLEGNARRAESRTALEAKP